VRQMQSYLPTMGEYIDEKAFMQSLARGPAQ